MKNFLVFWVAVAAVALTLGPVPALAGPDHSMAADFNLEEMQGKVVLVDFWASWCKPCAKSLPWLNRMQSTYGPQGLQVVAVNLDRNWEKASAMAGNLAEDVFLVHDPEGLLAAQRNLQGMPSAYLYDRSGKLAAVHVGFLSNEAPAREQEIAALLAGEFSAQDTASPGDDTARVQPWLRDLLAAEGMAIDSDPIETALDEHIYFSKEASSGGLGSAGGGCGCN